jgi:hypothetical protein
MWSTACSAEPRVSGPGAGAVALFAQAVACNVRSRRAEATVFAAARILFIGGSFAEMPRQGDRLRRSAPRHPRRALSLQKCPFDGKASALVRTELMIYGSRV